ncbi:hypothetical protein [uncultured Tateyamaria sp.]|uniref:hypothetical protein n=1 Tax=uncultured Tateyamaria sp. TaxID=455651 RepID=UPI0026151CCD|nr:hypothetical protein [uncultured Tateyamaria sp.]
MRGTAVISGGRTYHVVPDVVGRDRIFITGQVSDDADGRAMAREVQVTSPEPLLFAARSDSDIGLAGNAATVFSDRSVPHATTVTLSAEGYRARVQNITIPAFAPLPLRVDFAMRAAPFAIGGRVYGRTVGPTPTYEPVPGATLSISPLPAPGGELPLLLRQPLRAAPGAGATLRRRAIAPQADVVVFEDAQAGQAFVAMTDGTGVSAGQLLRTGPEHRRIYAQISQVLAHPDQPAPAALARLSEPLIGTIATGTTMNRFTLGGFSGANAALVGESFAGEAVLWLEALPASGGVLVLRAAGQPDRYHDAQIVTGPAGDYRVPGFARIGVPTLEVSAPGLTTDSAALAVATLRAGPVDWYLVP